MSRCLLQRCWGSGRRARTTGHRYDYLIAPALRPFPKPERTVPSGHVSPPAPAPRFLISLGETRPPPGGPPNPGGALRRVKGAGLPLAVRSPGSSRRPRRPPEGAPSPRPLVGSLSCGGGSQLLHIWLLLHIYILEQASERERARGREEGGEGKGVGGGGGGGESRVYRRHHFYYSGGAVQDLFHCRGIQNKPLGAAARATAAARHCFSPSAPPSPRHPRSIYTLQ